MPNGFTYHYVAFLDVLGFSEMVARDCNGPSANAVYLPILLRAHKTAIEQAQLFTGAKVTQFSDCILLAHPYAPSEFSRVVEHVANLQRSLLENGILSRGGLSYGKHFSDEEFIFSDALIRAYKIEQDRAIFPRVVIDDDLLDLIKPLDPEQMPALVREADGACFIDYMRGMSVEAAESAVLTATNGWEKTSVRVREKMRWLRDYAAFTFPERTHFQNNRFVLE